MKPTYYVCPADQTMSYLIVYCPNCKSWSRQFGRLARSTALELKLVHIVIDYIDEMLAGERDKWMARHSHTLDELSHEMLLATTNRSETEQLLREFTAELDDYSGNRLAYDAILENTRQQNDQK